MTSIMRKLDELEEVNEVLRELKKERGAPQRTFFDKLSGKKKTKEFKLPKKITSGHKKKVKQNYCLVFYLRNNGWMDINYAPIVNDLVYVKQSGQYHAATAEYIMRYKKFPTLIIPEWSIVPFSPKEHSEKASDEGVLASKQKYLIDMVTQAALKQPAKLPGKMLLLIIIGGVVALFIISEMLK